MVKEIRDNFKIMKTVTNLLPHTYQNEGIFEVSVILIPVLDI
jgi:hypothetical protein